ncbi:MAG TPA: glutathione S-transferase family protein [Beijerinckiaceae bacterium]|jgi:glutathione S-transferase|nr:glutathione S-transferase family protein [Beijerinckiaceae bacterium]
MALTLVLANKAYSSWSMRPWMVLKRFDIPFDEIVIPMNQPETHAEMLKHAPSGKCPSLHDGTISVWDSLAIIEYLAETYPTFPIWPRGTEARAYARSLSAEMHSGFMALRRECPMNIRRPRRAIKVSEDVRADVVRIDEAFADARTRFGAAGAFLFGDFSAADAMFAPVVNRFDTYDLPVSDTTRAYMAAMKALPAWQQWERDAFAEPWRIEHYEAI